MNKLGIGAIMRNEQPYILEWIAFHRVVGVEHFVIVDDSSNDGTTELLGRLAALGIINHVRLFRRPAEAPQLPAYRSILKQYGHRFEWLAFVDADEFIVPTDGLSVLPMLLEAASDTGAVLLNWATYGSSGAETEAPEPVIERFTQRAGKDWIVDHHTKAIVRTQACVSTGNTPHFFRLKSGWQSRHSDGSPYVPHPRAVEGFSQALVQSPVRINHYIVKSREEFLKRKRPRGRSDMIGGTRPLEYFEGHNRNERVDPVPPELVKATRAEIAQIQLRLESVTGEPLALRGLSILSAGRDYFTRV